MSGIMVKGTNCDRQKKDGTKCRSLALKNKTHCRFHGNSPMFVFAPVESTKCEWFRCPTEKNLNPTILKCGHQIHEGCLLQYSKECSMGISRCPICKKKTIDNPHSGPFVFFKENLSAYREHLISLQDLFQLLKSYNFQNHE